LIPADDIRVYVYPWLAVMKNQRTNSDPWLVVSQKTENPFLTLKWGSKQSKELGQKKNPKLLVHYWFFHENHSFLAGSFIRTHQIFENFGILAMRRSFDFQNIRESKQKYSLILKSFQNPRF
jgi:hypothetical protein